MDYPDPPLDSMKRLIIMILLEKRGNLVFSDLAKAMKISKGALDSHLKTLEKYGFIHRESKFIIRSPRTVIIPEIIGLQELNKSRDKWMKLLEMDDN